MSKLTAAITLLMIGATQAFAGTIAPEIDGSSALPIVALISGGLIVLRARRK